MGALVHGQFGIANGLHVLLFLFEVADGELSESAQCRQNLFHWGIGLMKIEKMIHLLDESLMLLIHLIDIEPESLVPLHKLYLTHSFLTFDGCIDAYDILDVAQAALLYAVRPVDVSCLSSVR